MPLLVPPPPPIANAVAIAGVDPSGGAGLLADLKTFTALGVYGCGIVTTLTAQNTQTVAALHLPPVDFFRQQLITLFADLSPHAIKTGMLATPELIEVLAEHLRQQQTHTPLPPLIVDPVLTATTGRSLLAPDALPLLKQQLLPLTTLLTPNLPEALALTDLPPPENPSALHRLLERLRALLPPGPGRWILLKGGHAARSSLLTDFAYDGETLLAYQAPRQPYANLHGTGCTLAAALTALIARWYCAAPFPPPPLTPARIAPLLTAAHRYLQAAIAGAAHLRAGRGALPLDHAALLRPSFLGSPLSPSPSPPDALDNSHL
ncbi:MAG: bifunctional hydroxymethylpyrimidine kinase/phosphomethylpyrimidine kinase [Hydrogenophilus sp.]|nr:bifunctional hydroxymethylpyrimidine kinase/phosphomethylpyrimidine kinase [Hydrogenophilus sp.]